MSMKGLCVLALFVCAAAPALAQTYGGNSPVCLQHFRWGGSDIECGYASMAQCAATASGLSAMCLVNPYYANAQVGPGPSHRRPRRGY